MFIAMHALCSLAITRVPKDAIRHWKMRRAVNTPLDSVRVSICRIRSACTRIAGRGNKIREREALESGEGIHKEKCLQSLSGRRSEREAGSNASACHHLEGSAPCYTCETCY